MSGTRDRFERVSAIFTEICDLAPQERQAALDRLCADDHDLRAEVLALLDEDDDPVLLTSPVAPEILRQVADSTLGLETRGTTESRSPFQPEMFATGDVLGPYRIERRVGEGGMGVVYKAAQLRPVRRDVAIKVLKRGSASAVQRFEREARALARMAHPSIASIYDAGATARNSPYVVMEYVDGEPLVRWCDSYQMSIRRRLELFEQICRGVAHAHQRGIIHRDLKPSNILVTMMDGDPRPKIIDFGIAKAISADEETDATLTIEHQMVGTPRYMSPEQAAGRLALVDTRSDVYSLGVVLYELIVGDTPFPEPDSDTGIRRMADLIAEQDPVRPSLKLKVSDQTGTSTDERAAERATDLAGLRRLVRGELDWIALKALERNQDRRYQTVVALADDIRRYLDGDAVEASPPSNVYRARKLLWRHRIAVLVASVLLGGLVLGLVGAMWGAIRAQRSAERTATINDFMFEVLTAPQPFQDGVDVRLIDVLGEAVDDLPDRMSSNPETGTDIAILLSDVFRSQGFQDLNLQTLEEAYPTVVAAFGPDDPRTLEFGCRLAMVLRNTAERGRAFELAREVRVRSERRLGPDHSIPLRCRRILCFELMINGRRDEAAAGLRQLSADSTRALGPDDINTLMVFDDLATVLARLGEPEAINEAIFNLRELIRRHERSGRPESSRTLTARLSLARLFFNDYRFEESLEVCRQIEDLTSQHATTQWGNSERVMITAMSLCGLQRCAEGIGPVKLVVDQLREERGDRDPLTLAQMDRAVHMMLAAGEVETGLEYARLLFDVMSSMSRRDSAPVIVFEIDVIRFRILGGDMDVLDDLAGVEEQLVDRPYADTSTLRSRLFRARAEYFERRGDLAQARAMAEQAYELVEPSRSRADDYMHTTWGTARYIAGLCDELGDTEAARDWWRLTRHGD